MKIIVLFVVARRVALLELASAGAVVAGLSDRFGWWAGAIAAGAAGMVKAFELDIAAGGDG